MKKEHIIKASLIKAASQQQQNRFGLGGSWTNRFLRHVGVGALGPLSRVLPGARQWANNGTPTGGSFDHGVNQMTSPSQPYSQDQTQKQQGPVSRAIGSSTSQPKSASQRMTFEELREYIQRNRADMQRLSAVQSLMAAAPVVGGAAGAMLGYRRPETSEGKTEGTLRGSMRGTGTGLGVLLGASMGAGAGYGGATARDSRRPYRAALIGSLLGAVTGGYAGHNLSGLALGPKGDKNVDPEEDDE